MRKGIILVILVFIYCNVININFNVLQWNKTHNTDGVDGFEIKRKGDSNVKCKIFLNFDQQPRKYKLSEELADLLGVREETKSGIIMGLWQYIKVI